MVKSFIGVVAVILILVGASVAQTTSGAISLENVMGSPNPGEISAGETVTFQLKLTNYLNETIQGMTNGFEIYSPDGAEWGNTFGDTVGDGWRDMFNLIYAINHMGADGQGIDSIFFGGAAFPGNGLPVGFDQIGYEITIGPIDPSYAGQTICIDSSFMPPSGIWRWEGDSGGPFSAGWDGPHCFEIVTEVIIDPPPDTASTSVSLDNVIGSPAPGVINSGEEVTFQFRVKNNSGSAVKGMTNGFVVYSDDGAEWGHTYADTLPPFGRDMFDLYNGITYFSADGRNADTVGFGAAVIIKDGVPDGFNEVVWQIRIGPIDSTHIGQTICIDSSFYPPNGGWRWQSVLNSNIIPDWDGPYCFEIVPSIMYDTIFNPLGDSLLLGEVYGAVNDHNGLMIQPVMSKLTQPINGATIPLKIPEGVKVYGLSRTGMMTENWDYAYDFVKADSGFLFVGLANSFGELIPTGTTTLFNILYKAINNSCTDSMMVYWDTALMGDVSRQLTYSSETHYPIYPGYNKADNYTALMPYLPGDINNTRQVDVSDLLYLIELMYLAGNEADVVNTKDINGDCIGPDIADLTYLVAYQFQSGAYPFCGCLDQNDGKVIPQSSLAALEYEYKNGYTTFYLKSEIDILGLEFELFQASPGVPVIEFDDRFDLIHNENQGLIKGAILDLEGQSNWTAGRHEVLRIEGEVNLISAVAADGDHNSFYLKYNRGLTGPDSYRLSQNYPNPFNPVTNISFILPVGEQVKVAIYNINGQKVIELANGYYEAGEHAVEFNGADYSSGVYFYKIKAGTFSETKKMILLK